MFSRCLVLKLLSHLYFVFFFLGWSSAISIGATTRYDFFVWEGRLFLLLFFILSWSNLLCHFIWPKTICVQKSVVYYSSCHSPEKSNKQYLLLKISLDRLIIPWQSGHFQALRGLEHAVFFVLFFCCCFCISHAKLKKARWQICLMF